jgi:hypothetical protein
MYLIERKIPGAGMLTPDDLSFIYDTFKETASQMGYDIQFLESFVADDRFFCVCIAENENIIRNHSIRGGYPLEFIHEIKSVLTSDPTQYHGSGSTPGEVQYGNVF